MSGSWLSRLPLTISWKISGTFARRHRWVLLGPCHLCVHGPPAFRSFTSVQMLHTHTCSEISYRITDVECIVRAKTLQLNLTGEKWKTWPEEVWEWILIWPQLEATVPSDIVGSNSDCENRATRKLKIENKLFGNGLVVLGLATSHCRKWTWK